MEDLLTEINRVGSHTLKAMPIGYYDQVKTALMIVEAGAEGLTATDQFYALTAPLPSLSEFTHLKSSTRENLRQGRIGYRVQAMVP
jgi:hypothetical protein